MSAVDADPKVAEEEDQLQADAPEDNENENDDSTNNAATFSLPGSISRHLEQIYRQAILPVEKSFSLKAFKSNEKPFTHSAFNAKPLVMLLGYTGTGKTSFIKSLMGRNSFLGDGDKFGAPFPSEMFTLITSGNELPGADKVAGSTEVQYVEHEHLIPGNAVVSDSSLPFTSLADLKVGGPGFIDRFQRSVVNSHAIRDIMILDTPGIIPGAKHTKASRGYDFASVIQAFGKKSDLILLFFEEHNLEISVELEEVLNKLARKGKNIRVIFNKVDALKEQELLLKYGSLKWNLASCQSPIFKSSNHAEGDISLVGVEEVRIYMTSFAKTFAQLDAIDNRCVGMIKNCQEDILHQIKSLPVQNVQNKIFAVQKRASSVKLHAEVLTELKKRVPQKFFGQKQAEHEFVNHLKTALENIATDMGRDVEMLKYLNTTHSRDTLLSEEYRLTKYPKLNKKVLEKIDTVIEVALPMLLSKLNGVSDEGIGEELVGLGIIAKPGSKAAKKAVRKSSYKSLFPKMAKVVNTGNAVPAARNRSNSVKSTSSMFSVATVRTSMGNVLRGMKTVGGLRKTKTQGNNTTTSNLPPSKAAAVQQGYRLSQADLLFDDENKDDQNKEEGAAPARNSLARMFPSAINTKGRRQKSYARSVVSQASQSSMVEQEIPNNDDEIRSEQVQSLRKQMKQAAPSKVGEKKIGLKGKPTSPKAASVISPAPPNAITNVADGLPWSVSPEVQAEASHLFHQQKLLKGKFLTGTAALEAFKMFDAKEKAMRKVWKLCDIDQSDQLDEEEFALAVHFLKLSEKGEKIPASLSPEDIPPSHRV